MLVNVMAMDFVQMFRLDTVARCSPGLRFRFEAEMVGSAHGDRLGAAVGRCARVIADTRSLSWGFLFGYGERFRNLHGSEMLIIRCFISRH